MIVLQADEKPRLCTAAVTAYLNDGVVKADTRRLQAQAAAEVPDGMKWFGKGNDELSG